ncbi:MAG: acetate--CoA ligase family protein [Nanoarchaeota archaeon]|nr:acetate--CoA ligase family protein [Nanoarchaeota archaeon]
MASKKKAKKTEKKPEIRKTAKAAEPIITQAKRALPAVQKKMGDEKAYDLLKRYGIPLTHYSFAKSEKELLAALKKIGYPAIMKISGRSIIHKTELGGIITVSNEEEAKQARKKLLAIGGVEKVLAQKKLEGIEVIVGAKRDPQFGAVVVFGFGGIYAEIIKDVVFRICPITPEDAEQMIKSVKGYEILAGARGKPVNIEALKDVLVKICRLASREGIREMDINPLFINEEGCRAADVRIVGK